MPKVPDLPLSDGGPGLFDKLLMVKDGKTVLISMFELAQYLTSEPIAADGTFVQDGILFGPAMGIKGPREPLFGYWNQGDVGYCYETNNVAENLPAKWDERGFNVCKAVHPDFVLGGRGPQLLAAVKAAGHMMMAAPEWSNTIFGFRPDTAPLDLRDLAFNDPDWRTKWIAFPSLDEPDLFLFSLQQHLDFYDGHAVGGVNKPGFVNLTRRIAIPASMDGGAAILWYEIANARQIRGLSTDSYEYHLTASDLQGPSANKSLPENWISTHNSESVWSAVGDPNIVDARKASFGRRMTASVSSLATWLLLNGPVVPGRSDSGNMPVQYPPIYFNDPPFTVRGRPILPQPMTFDPGEKWGGHYITTSRVEVASSSYPRSGRWQPGRALRSEGWGPYFKGSCALWVFPQTVGSKTATGYIDAANNQLVITAVDKPFLFGGAMRVTAVGSFTLRGWVRCDNHQISGTPGGAGVYALDPAKGAPVATGTVGAPVTLEFSTEARPWGDDSNPENLAELAALIANIKRLCAHPTGGNLFMDPVNGGRRPFVALHCPDIDGDASLYKNDFTLAPIQAGYTPEGVPIPDAAGGLPKWLFGWPVGFEGNLYEDGADGADYIVFRSMSNGEAPTWFPGFAPLGLPARVMGPHEVVEYRRAGAGMAVETGGIIKAGVDDGAATWFWIENAAITQPEGTGAGTTTISVTVRRGGVITGSQSVTATVTAEGANPVNAADFTGGVFPSEVLAFAANESSKTFAFTINRDSAGELDETGAVVLSAPSGGAQIVGSRKGRVPFTVTNDDAAVVGATIWLSESMSGPPALAGVPAGSVHLRRTEIANVTRGGITMRSRGGGNGYDTGVAPALFADVPAIASNSAFNGVLLELSAGNWEIAAICAAFAWGSGVNGTLRVVDDPNGAANLRQSVALAAAGAVLVDTDGTAYATAPTAIAEAFNNLTFLPVTVSNLGGGMGLLQIHGASGGLQIAAISLRQVT